MKYTPPRRKCQHCGMITRDLRFIDVRGRRVLLCPECRLKAKEGKV